MNQKFFTNTIKSKFIKNVIYNTPLPILPTVTDGDYIIKDFIYIYQSYSIKCKESGYINPVDPSHSIAKYDVLDHSFFVDFSTNHKKSERFESTYDYYDTDTHVWLGRYLRFYRDVWHTDLMPFYNCFSGVYTSKFFIDADLKVQQSGYDYYQQGSSEFRTRYQASKDKKIVQVPVKFNRKYTIAIDCSSEIGIAAAFIDNGQLLKVPIFNGVYNLTDLYNNLNSVFSYSSSSFTSPFIYETINRNSDFPEGSGVDYENLFQRYEKYLYLLIQIPAENNSSIVILEGDYTDQKVNKVFSTENIDSVSDKELNSLCVKGLSLLQFSDEIRHPFADRLIEYLLWNVIDNNDLVGDNIKRVQDKVGILTSKSVVPGAWTDNLRAFLFLKYTNYKKSKNIDVLGYVDKDIEKYLFG